MRSTKATIAGLGTSGSLVGAAICVFLLVSALIAFKGWPGADGREDAAPLRLDDSTATATVSGPAAVADAAGPAAAAVASVPGGSVASPGGSPGTEPTIVSGPAIGVVDDSDRGDGASGSDPQRSGGTSPASAQPDPVAGLPGSPGSSGMSDQLAGVISRATAGVSAAITRVGQQLGGAVAPQVGQTVEQTTGAAGDLVGATGEAVGGVGSGVGTVVEQTTGDTAVEDVAGGTVEDVTDVAEDVLDGVLGGGGKDTDGDKDDHDGKGDGKTDKGDGGKQRATQGRGDERGAKERAAQGEGGEDEAGGAKQD